MLPDPAASVVIPVRNAGVHVETALDSLAEQAVRNRLELVVVDDGSTDDTAGRVERWIAAHPAVAATLVRRPERGGPNAARNAGVAAASCEFLLFCDGDDVVAPDWSDWMLGARRPRTLLAGALDTRTISPQVPDQAWLRTDLPRVSSQFLPYAFGGNMAIDRVHVEEIGGFDESIFEGGTEIDFAWRLQICAGVRVVAVPEAVVHYRITPSTSGQFRRRYRKARGACYLRAKHGPGVRSARDLRAHVGAWGHLAVRAPLAVVQPSRRSWVASQAGFLAGHVAGSIRHRVVYL